MNPFSFLLIQGLKVTLGLQSAMEAASLQCQPFEQPENNGIVHPAGMRGTDVGGNLITEKGLTTSSVAVPESTPPSENGAHEVLVEPMNGSAPPEGAKAEQDAAKGAQEQESGQAENIPGPEDGEGELYLLDEHVSKLSLQMQACIAK